MKGGYIDFYRKQAFLLLAALSGCRNARAGRMLGRHPDKYYFGIIRAFRLPVALIICSADLPGFWLFANRLQTLASGLAPWAFNDAVSGFARGYSRQEAKFCFALLKYDLTRESV
jgi:hypothetical protein